MILFFWILIQIISESLPISSSGHVALLQLFLNQSLQNSWVVDFLLHAPTIVILLVYFFSTWWKMVFKQGFSLLLLSSFFIIIADLITFGFWILNLSSLTCVQNYFLPFGFCITALCLFFSRSVSAGKAVRWSFRDAVILGTVQGICLLPGISRFAGTYAAGIWLGYARKDAFSLSFLIQMPLLCAALAKGMVAIAAQPEIVQNFMSWWIVLTFVIASVVSYKLFCWVAGLIEQNRLWYFAFYMMIPMFVSFWMVKDTWL